MELTKKDVFDMVGLAFDPPETNARQVKKKIDQKKAELIRAKLYLSEEDEKALQDYSDKENQRQNERNKGMDWRN